MEPALLKAIPRNSAVGMDKVFAQLFKAKERVYGHVINTGFIDIGSRKSYLNAYKRYASRLGKI
jgi:mannose-1-phosphate guanylyltransferase